MTLMRILIVSALTLLVTACGEPREPDLSPYAGQPRETATEDSDGAAEAGGDEGAEPDSPAEE